VFSEKECTRIKTRAIEDFTSNLPSSTTGKPISCSNSNRLAVWLNYVPHHLGRTHPRYLPEVKIDLDPYAGSLSAIDALLAKPRRKAKAKAKTGIEGRRFRVALSFPGEHRVYVASVAEILKARLGAAAVFYDHDYSAELARPNLDLLLQRIYHDNSDLTVVFLCADYTQKEWCGLEWRAIRDIIKQRADAKIMLLRLDAGPVPGVFSIDGYVDVSNLPPDETAKAIERRLTALP
jgi:hypothetical protein